MEPGGEVQRTARLAGLFQNDDALSAVVHRLNGRGQTAVELLHAGLVQVGVQEFGGTARAAACGLDDDIEGLQRADDAKQDKRVGGAGQVRNGDAEESVPESAAVDLGGFVYGILDIL